jgi:hypothetical protein
VAGPAGPAGDPGPVGPSGGRAYAYVYNVIGESVAVEHDVTFSAGGVLSPGFVHAPNAAAITIVDPGTYKVSFTVSAAAVNQVALFVNGVEVPGSVYGSAAGAQQNAGQAIITIASGDVVDGGANLTVRNHTSSADIALATPQGGTQITVNASVLIEGLG